MSPILNDPNVDPNVDTDDIDPTTGQPIQPRAKQSLGPDYYDTKYNQWYKWIRYYSKLYGADPPLVAAHIQQESSFNPTASSNNVNDAGTIVSKNVGLGQINDAYYKGVLTDPETNIKTTASILGSLTKKYGGDIAKIVTEYKAGGASPLLNDARAMRNYLNTAGKPWGAPLDEVFKTYTNQFAWLRTEGGPTENPDVNPPPGPVKMPDSYTRLGPTLTSLQKFYSSYTNTIDKQIKDMQQADLNAEVLYNLGHVFVPGSSIIKPPKPNPKILELNLQRIHAAQESDKTELEYLYWRVAPNAWHNADWTSFDQSIEWLQKEFESNGKSGNVLNMLDQSQIADMKQVFQDVSTSIAQYSNQNQLVRQMAGQLTKPVSNKPRTLIGMTSADLQKSMGFKPTQNLPAGTTTDEMLAAANSAGAHPVFAEAGMIKVYADAYLKSYVANQARLLNWMSPDGPSLTREEKFKLIREQPMLAAGELIGSIATNWSEPGLGFLLSHSIQVPNLNPISRLLGQPESYNIGAYAIATGLVTVGLVSSIATPFVGIPAGIAAAVYGQSRQTRYQSEINRWYTKNMEAASPQQQVAPWKVEVSLPIPFWPGGIHPSISGMGYIPSPDTWGMSSKAYAEAFNQVTENSKLDRILLPLLGDPLNLMGLGIVAKSVRMFPALKTLGAVDLATMTFGNKIAVPFIGGVVGSIVDPALGVAGALGGWILPKLFHVIPPTLSQSVMKSTQASGRVIGAITKQFMESLPKYSGTGAQLPNLGVMRQAFNEGIKLYKADGVNPAQDNVLAQLGEQVRIAGFQWLDKPQIASIYAKLTGTTIEDSLPLITNNMMANLHDQLIRLLDGGTKSITNAEGKILLSQMGIRTTTKTLPAKSNLARQILSDWHDNVFIEGLKPITSAKDVVGATDAFMQKVGKTLKTNLQGDMWQRFRQDAIVQAPVRFENPLVRLANAGWVDAVFGAGARVSAPIARHYLLFALYGPMNVAENYLRIWVAGLSPSIPHGLSALELLGNTVGDLVGFPMEFRQTYAEFKRGMKDGSISAELGSPVFDTKIYGLRAPAGAGWIPGTTKDIPYTFEQLGEKFPALAKIMGKPMALVGKLPGARAVYGKYLQSNATHSLAQANDWFAKIGTNQKSWYLFQQFQRNLVSKDPQLHYDMAKIIDGELGTLGEFFTPTQIKNFRDAMHNAVFQADPAAALDGLAYTRDHLLVQDLIHKTNAALAMLPQIPGTTRYSLLEMVQNGQMNNLDPTSIDRGLSVLLASWFENDVMGKVASKGIMVDDFFNRLGTRVPQDPYEMLGMLGDIRNLLLDSSQSASEMRQAATLRAHEFTRSADRKAIHTDVNNISQAMLDTLDSRLSEQIPFLRQHIDNVADTPEQAHQMLQWLDNMVQDAGHLAQVRRDINDLHTKVFVQHDGNYTNDYIPGVEAIWRDYLRYKATSAPMENILMERLTGTSSFHPTSGDAKTILTNGLTPSSLSALYGGRPESLLTGLIDKVNMTIQTKRQFVDFHTNFLGSALGVTPDELNRMGVTNAALGETYDSLLRSINLDPNTPLLDAFLPMREIFRGLRTEMHTIYQAGRIDKPAAFAYNEAVRKSADAIRKDTRLYPAAGVTYGADWKTVKWGYQESPTNVYGIPSQPLPITSAAKQRIRSIIDRMPSTLNFKITNIVIDDKYLSSAHAQASYVPPWKVPSILTGIYPEGTVIFSSRINGPIGPKELINVYHELAHDMLEGGMYLDKNMMAEWATIQGHPIIARNIRVGTQTTGYLNPKTGQHDPQASKLHESLAEGFADYLAGNLVKKPDITGKAPQIQQFMETFFPKKGAYASRKTTIIPNSTVYQKAKEFQQAFQTNTVTPQMDTEFNASIGRQSMATSLSQLDNMITDWEAPSKYALSPAWKANREQAMADSVRNLHLDFPNYDDQTAFDAMMKAVYPFWFYEKSRWPYIARVGVTHPGLANSWNNYMQNTDTGYVDVPVPTPDPNGWFGIGLRPTNLQINPTRGTVLGTLRGMWNPDYPEYADAMPDWYNSALSYTERAGFYPGFHVLLPMAAFGSKLGIPQYGEILPQWSQTMLGALYAAPGIPDNVKATITDHIFPSRFRDYQISQMVKQNGGDGNAIFLKMREGVALTPAEQEAWNTAKDYVMFTSAVLDSQVGMFRIHPKDQQEYLTAVKLAIQSQNGVSPAMQDKIRKYQSVTGQSVSSLYPMDPLSQWLVNQNLEQYKNWQGPSTAPLLPSAWGELTLKIESYYMAVDKIHTAAYDTGFYRTKQDGTTEMVSPSMKQLEEEFRSGKINAAQYKTESADVLTKMSDQIAALADTDIYKGVPITRKQRVDYYTTHNVPLPTWDAGQELMWMYYDIKPQMTVDENGVRSTDWEGYFSNVDNLLSAMNPIVRDRFVQRLQAEWTNTQKLYQATSQKYLSGYKNLDNVVLTNFTPAEQAMLAQYQKADILERKQIRGLQEAPGQKLVADYESQLSTLKANLRASSPELDAWLAFWGKTSTFQTAAGEARYRQLLTAYRPGVKQ